MISSLPACGLSSYEFYTPRIVKSMLTCELDQMHKTQVTGIPAVDSIQEGVGNLAGSQLGKGGVGEGVGKTMDSSFLRGPG